MIEHVRLSIMSRLSKITEGDSLIYSLTSDKVIKEHLKRGEEYAIDKIVDDYYKYEDIVFDSGGLNKIDEDDIADGMSLYKLFPMIDDSINRLYEVEPLEFKTYGVACLNCGSRKTNVELERLLAGDEGNIMKVTCLNCAHASG